MHGRHRKDKVRRSGSREASLKIASVAILIMALFLTILWVTNTPLIELNPPCILSSKVSTQFSAILNYVKFNPESRYLRLNAKYVAFYFMINDKKYYLAAIPLLPNKEVTVNKGVSINAENLSKSVFLGLYDNVSKITYPIGKLYHNPLRTVMLHTFLYEALITAGFENTSLNVRVTTSTPLVINIKLIIGEEALVKTYRVGVGTHNISVRMPFNNYYVSAYYNLGVLTFTINKGSAMLLIGNNLLLKLLVLVLYGTSVLLLLFSRKLVKSR